MSSTDDSRATGPARAGLRDVLTIGLVCGGIALAARAGTIYVNAAAAGADAGTSWKDAYTELQHALAEAASGDEVWVAGGTYKTDATGIDATKSFDLPASVTLRGGFAGNEVSPDDRPTSGFDTILTGDLLENDVSADDLSFQDNAHHVLVVEDSSYTLLDRLVVRGGSSHLGPGGSGIWISKGSAALLDCTITGNRLFASGASGGGVLGESSMLSVKNCTFVDNGERDGFGGGLGLVGTVATISDCTFEANHSVYKGGASISVDEQSSVDVRDTAFSENFCDKVLGGSGGGLYILQSTSSSPSLVERCQFLQNSEDVGAAIVVYADDALQPASDPLVIRSCLFVGNVSKYAPGGAVTVAGGSVEISDSTFAYNTCKHDAGGAVGAYIFGFQLQMMNCILWSNKAPSAPAENQQFYPGDTGEQLGLDVTHCCIQDVSQATLDAWGIGNMALNPQFVDPLGSDGTGGTGDENLRLSPGSPAIDGGVPNEEYGTDLDGCPRWIDGDLDGLMQVDMGAYEFSNVTLAVTTELDKIDFDVTGDSSLLGMLIIGREPGDALIPPFGELMVDTTFGINRWIIGMLPVHLGIDNASVGQWLDGSTLTIQALAVSADAKVGNLSATVELSPSQVQFVSLPGESICRALRSVHVDHPGLR